MQLISRQAVSLLVFWIKILTCPSQSPSSNGKASPGNFYGFGYALGSWFPNKQLPVKPDLRDAEPRSLRPALAGEV